ncbi:MAG: PEGA domain-containing protein [Polyangiaceae bacterium]|nr:PEGA domain-containing protein [Polyangiaceae bacterium]
MKQPPESTRTCRRTNSVLLGTLTFLFALHLQAQPHPRGPTRDQAKGDLDHRSAADALFREGLELASQDRFSEAAFAFDEAYRASPHFAVLYNAAQAHRRAGHLAKALDAFRRYLDEGGSAVPLDRVSEIREQIRSLRERLGEVTVSVSPADATIFIDGEQESSDRAALVEPGDHMVLAARTGLSPEYRVVPVHAGEAVRVTLALAAPPSTPSTPGWLAVECGVPAVQIVLDGRPATTVRGRAWIRASPGSHRVELRRAGYRSDVHSVTIERERVSPMRCEMEPLEPLVQPWKADLSVRAHPTDAEILLDDVPLPSSGAVPAGLHRLRVVRTGYQPWTQDVVLEARQPTRLDLSLRPTDAYAEKHRAHADRQRAWSYGFLAAGALLAGAGGYLYLHSRSDWRRWDGRQNDLDAAWADPPADQTTLRDEQRQNDELSRSVQRETQAAIAFGVAGVSALATGVYLYLTADSASER